MQKWKIEINLILGKWIFLQPDKREKNLDHRSNGESFFLAKRKSDSRKQKQKYFFKSTTFIWEDRVSNLVLEKSYLVLSLVQSVLILLMPVFVFDLLFIIEKKTMKNIKLSLKHIYALILRAKISQICHLGQEYFSDCMEIHTHPKICPRSLRLG